MHLRKLARASLYLAIGCSICGFDAVADEELPAVHTLPCETTCANSSAATGVSQPLPAWPAEFIRSMDTYVEGYVRLHYKINPDGHVSDISVVSVVGPKKFAENSVSTVKDWIYKPAMLDGKAVATCHTLMVKFKMNNWGSPGGRSEIVKAYKDALASAKDNKWDEAQAILTEALAKPKLNLYERGMLSNVAALIAIKKADYLEAHRLSIEAIAFSSEDLPVSVRQSLLQTRIRSAAMLGDIVDALDATDKLKSMRELDPSDPTVRFVEAIQSKADGMSVFATTAKIPEVEMGQVTYFGLYRRNFAFQDIKGSLSGFTLTCKQQSIESQITDTAEWHVPKSWSDCRILVRGAAGTTFKIAQASS
jgi:TonB family protein